MNFLLKKLLQRDTSLEQRKTPSLGETASVDELSLVRM